MSDAWRAYAESRFRFHPARQKVWAHLCAYLNRRWIPSGSRVIDLGAGYCSFINQVQAAERWACEANVEVARHAGPGVRIVNGGLAGLASVPAASVDVAFASNLFEHLTRPELDAALTEVRRVLAQDGRLIVMQPNFKHCMSTYFDDYTHVAVFTDASLTDLLRSRGFRIRYCHPRFLPYSFRSRLGSWSFLVPLYLRSPFRPFGAQMLVVADKEAAD